MTLAEDAEVSKPHMSPVQVGTQAIELELMAALGALSIANGFCQ